MIITNDGPRITSTDYWQTEHSRRGILYLSINAGCFRLLVPTALAPEVDEMRSAKHIIISMLPKLKRRDGQYAVEWMADDGTDDPWSCHLSPGQCDRLPRRVDADATAFASQWREPTATGQERRRQYEARVYTAQTTAHPRAEIGDTVELLRLPAYLRWVESLPCLEPIEETMRRAAKGDA